MRIIAWNCRVLGNQAAVLAAKWLIRSEVPEVVFFSKTKRKSQEILAKRTYFNLPNMFPVDCSGQGNSRAGGLCLLWSADVEIEVINFSINHILFWINPSIPNERMQVLAIYGYPEERRKKDTWALIACLKPRDDIPWLCVGDFNDLLSPNDKLGVTLLILINCRWYHKHVRTVVFRS